MSAALRQTSRVDMGPVIRDYIGNDAILLNSIHAAADAITTSSIAGSRYSFSMTADQYRDLCGLLDYAAIEFEPGLRRETTKSDRTERMPDGGECLTLSGELV